MYQAWLPLLPGVSWPVTAGGFVVGLLWLVIYSIYFTVLIAWPYNQWTQRQTA
jgi:hypothetical protein